MKPVILIVEDDKDLLQYLQSLLIEQNFSVKTATTGVAALQSAQESTPDLVLLDFTLPDMNGESICLDLKRATPELPIIMLTARDAVSDKVRLLNVGADDYITKPFIADELIARINARLRTQSNNEDSITIGDLVLDRKKIEVTRAGQVISLTPQEFKLLDYLMSNKGIVLTRDMILNRIWDYSADVETRVVDVYIGYLRKKIDSGHPQKLLHSIRGFGYTIKEEE